MTAPLSIERRADLLAVADADVLVAAAEQLLADGLPEPRVVTQPELGMVMLQVREPIAEERFYLAEVLVTRSEVELAGVTGWAMRMGDDRMATLAAAVLAAAAESAPSWQASVDALCTTTESALTQARNAEWAELATTQVEFEELDT